MSRLHQSRIALLAVPGVALALVGAMHPHHLTYATSALWAGLHVAGVLVFPLLGVALGALVWGRLDPLAVAILVAAYVYAVAYTALDVISGVAAGYVTHRIGPGVPRPDEVRYLFEIGGRLGEYGAWAFLLAAVLVAVDHLRRMRLSALAPSLLLVVAAWSFLSSHIFLWRGVLTMLAIGVATAWLAHIAASERSGHQRGETGAGTKAARSRPSA